MFLSAYLCLSVCLSVYLSVCLPFGFITRPRYMICFGAAHRFQTACMHEYGEYVPLWQCRTGWLLKLKKSARIHEQKSGTIHTNTGTQKDQTWMHTVYTYLAVGQYGAHEAESRLGFLYSEKILDNLYTNHVCIWRYTAHTLVLWR